MLEQQLHMKRSDPILSTFIFYENLIYINQRLKTASNANERLQE